MELLWTAGFVPCALLGKGFAEPSTSKRHNIVMARWIGDDPKVICRMIRHRETPKKP